MAEQEALSPKQVLEDIRSNSFNAPTEREFFRSILVLEKVADKPRVRICLDALGNSWFGRAVMVSLVRLDADLSVVPDDQEARDELLDGVRAASILGLEKIEEYKPFLDGFRKRHSVEPGSAAEPTSRLSSIPGEKPAPAEPREGAKKSGVELLANPEIRQRAEEIFEELRRVENHYLGSREYSFLGTLGLIGVSNEQIVDPDTRSSQELQDELSMLLNLEGDESCQVVRNLIQQGDYGQSRIDIPALFHRIYGQDNPDEQIRLLGIMYSKAPEKLYSLFRERVEAVRDGRSSGMAEIRFKWVEEDAAGIDKERQDLQSVLESDKNASSDRFEVLIRGEQTGSLEDLVQAFINRNQATAALWRFLQENDQLVHDFQQNLAKAANIKITHDDKGKVILEEIPPATPAGAQPAAAEPARPGLGGTDSAEAEVARTTPLELPPAPTDLGTVFPSPAETLPAAPADKPGEKASPVPVQAVQPGLDQDSRDITAGVILQRFMKSLQAGEKVDLGDGSALVGALRRAKSVLSKQDWGDLIGGLLGYANLAKNQGLVDSLELAELLDRIEKGSAT